MYLRTGERVKAPFFNVSMHTVPRVNSLYSLDCRAIGTVGIPESLTRAAPSPGTAPRSAHPAAAPPRPLAAAVLPRRSRQPRVRRPGSCAAGPGRSDDPAPGPAAWSAHAVPGLARTRCARPPLRDRTRTHAEGGDSPHSLRNGTERNGSFPARAKGKTPGRFLTH